MSNLLKKLALYTTAAAAAFTFYSGDINEANAANITSQKPKVTEASSLEKLVKSKPKPSKVGYEIGQTVYVSNDGKIAVNLEKDTAKNSRIHTLDIDLNNNGTYEASEQFEGRRNGQTVVYDIAKTIGAEKADKLIKETYKTGKIPVNFKFTEKDVNCKKIGERGNDNYKLAFVNVPPKKILTSGQNKITTTNENHDISSAFNFSKNEDYNSKAKTPKLIMASPNASVTYNMDTNQTPRVGQKLEDVLKILKTGKTIPSLDSSTINPANKVYTTSPISLITGLSIDELANQYQLNAKSGKKSYSLLTEKINNEPSTKIKQDLTTKIDLKPSTDVTKNDSTIGADVGIRYSTITGIQPSLGFSYKPSDFDLKFRIGVYGLLGGNSKTSSSLKDTQVVPAIFGGGNLNTTDYTTTEQKNVLGFDFSVMKKMIDNTNNEYWFGGSFGGGYEEISGKVLRKESWDIGTVVKDSKSYMLPNSTNETIPILSLGLVSEGIFNKDGNFQPTIFLGAGMDYATKKSNLPNNPNLGGYINGAIGFRW